MLSTAVGLLLLLVEQQGPWCIQYACENKNQDTKSKASSGHQGVLVKL